MQAVGAMEAGLEVAYPLAPLDAPLVGRPAPVPFGAGAVYCGHKRAPRR
jgi:hypothetical protein